MQFQKSNTKFKVAILGLGHQALEDYLPAVLASKDVYLSGIVEIDEEKISLFQKEHKEIPIYKSFDHLLKDQKINFVIITLPHYLHYDATKKTIQNKIHVLKEKPMAISLNQAKELKKLAEKKQCSNCSYNAKKVQSYLFNIYAVNRQNW